MSCIPVCVKRAPAQTRWKCIDVQKCLAWAAHACPTEFHDLDCFHNFILDLQHLWGDRRRCKAKRMDRLPMQIRDLYARARCATDEDQRLTLQKAAWAALKHWKAEVQATSTNADVQRGRVITRSKKLHKVKSMVLSSASGELLGTVTDDHSQWAVEVQQQFGSKWGCLRIQDRINMLDFMLQHEGVEINFSNNDLLAACKLLRKQAKLDHYGVALEAVLLFCRACPEVAVEFFARSMASSPFMSSIRLQGNLYGKESQTSAATQLRSISPLPAVLQVMDALLLQLASPVIDVACPEPPGCFIGARPFTLALDIAHGLQAVIEKELDDHGRAAIAQEDIEKYYDSLRLLRVARWLQRNGATSATCAAMLRHQMLPQVTLAIGGIEVSFSNRSVGSLTGSRVAGALGRVPV